MVHELMNSMTFSYLGMVLVDSIVIHSVRPQEMLQIEWKQKDKIEYGTFDKEILTPPSIGICPPFDELKQDPKVF